MPKKPRPVPPASTPERAVQFIGERLRQLREARGLSQETLAARAKVSAKFIGEVERATTNTSVTVLWQLAVDGLGVSLSEFFQAADGAVADDVATATAIVSAQTPEARRRGIRVLRALYEP